MDAEIAELAASIMTERVIRARATPPEAKFLAGYELFESACEVTRWGIRGQNPGATDEEVAEELRRRLAIGEKIGSRRVNLFRGQSHEPR